MRGQFRLSGQRWRNKSVVKGRFVEVCLVGGCRETMLISEEQRDAGETKQGRFLTRDEEEDEGTHLVEEKEILPKPQSENEIAYLWWDLMSQHDAQILFMEVDSWSDQ